jgi:hypothetical protein
VVAVLTTYFNRLQLRNITTDYVHGFRMTVQLRNTKEFLFVMKKQGVFYEVVTSFQILCISNSNLKILKKSSNSWASWIWTAGIQNTLDCPFRQTCWNECEKNSYYTSDLSPLSKVKVHNLKGGGHHIYHLYFIYYIIYILYATYFNIKPSAFWPSHICMCLYVQKSNADLLDGKCECSLN